QPSQRAADVHPQEDGSYVIDGSANIREVNRELDWHLPCDGPRTINGLVTEALENIPDSSVCLKIGPYRLEILEPAENRVKHVRAWRADSPPDEASAEH
ncbi:MAG: magnesium/cobalt efflux protein, partial [Pseudomonas sagittaria]|nr:magnesium/cobalt efflux protein [Pseudomonas sagittaria]